MSKYAKKEFWVGTADRAVATFAQAALAVFSASFTGILEVDMTQMFSVAGLAAVTSLCWSFANPERVIAPEKDASEKELELMIEKQLVRALGKEGQPTRLGRHGVEN